MESATPRAFTRYIALGDSYSSGVGAPVSKTDRTCGRSDSAWPRYLQAALPSKPAITFKACSGATTLNVLPVGTPVAVPEPINKVDDPVPQITALQNLTDPQNTLVTITIGGNDAKVGPTMLACLARNFKVCSADEIAKRLTDAVTPRLKQTFLALKNAAPDAAIVAVGYPYLVAKPGKQCPLTIGTVSDATRTVIRDGIDKANKIVSDAAHDANIYSITTEVRDAFADNEACSLESDFINTVQVPRGVSPAGAFHPNLAGNKAYAEAILQGLTKLGLISTVATVARPTDVAPPAPLPVNNLPPGQTSTVPQPATSAAKPTTANPTTAKPTSSNPTTAKPTSANPTTAKPDGANPTTAKPTTAKPTSANPTTAKPTTAKPEGATVGGAGASPLGDDDLGHGPDVGGHDTEGGPDNEPGPDQPCTGEPGPDDPVIDEVGSDQPGTDKLCTDEPGTDQPGTDQPGTDEPGTDQPGTDQPGTDQPGTDQPGTDQPGTDQPGTDQPGSDQPGSDQPGTDQPGTDEPGTDQPGTDEPGSDQPGTDEPGSDQPGTDQPGTDEPGTDQPGTDQPGTDQPGTDQPGTDEPGTDQPGTDEEPVFGDAQE